MGAEETSERDKSEFNDSLGYLARLNMVLFSCLQSRVNLDASKWFYSLEGLGVELSTEMNEEELKRLDEFSTKTIILIEVWNKKKEKGTIKVSQELYQKLNEHERFLRKIYKDAGLQQRVYDEDDLL